MVTPRALAWKRIAACVAYMTAAVVAAMIVLAPKAPPEVVFADPRPVSQEDQARILLALVRHYATEGLPLPPPKPGEGRREEPRRVVVVARESLTLCRHEGTYYGDLNCPDYEFDTSTPYEWRHQLIVENATSRPQPTLVGPLLRTWTVAEYRRVIDAEWWNGFYARHPGTSGFTQVSWAVWSDDGEQALVYVEHACGGKCGTGMLHVLARDGDRWRIEHSTRYWIS